MNYSLENYLRLVVPYLSDVLVSQQQLTAIKHLTEILPPLSPMLLECRLAAEQPRVDVSVGLQPMKFLIPEPLISYPFWQQLESFCQDWTTVNSFVYQTVKDMWLEFDLDGLTDGLTVACWFFSLRGEEFQDKNIEANLKLVKLISLLQNCPLDQQRKALVERCVNALPDGVGISQIGAMRSRPGKPLRINVDGLSPQMIPTYLAKIQGEPVPADLTEMITLIQPLSDRIVLCFDIEEQIGSRIGLECYLNQQPKKEPRWSEFLNLAVAMKCCTPQKRDALLQWPGLIQKKDQPELWPVNLQYLDSLISPGSFSVFWRTINHLKLVYQPGCPLEVKAYLAVGHRWFKAD
ncbi:hypothetical protein [Anabaena sp. CA = ATCC 33047]|uniref:hypothetical protein n=1 Tax=Anabaena sp. (strain CA / ATCC 33047) TaxID=52271 RepID=UPI00082C12B6|nr:hypothetical protein [Anabaena sp. CA = ATCC 33047]